MLLVADPSGYGPGRREEDRVVAAFKAADEAIRTALSRDGKWDVEELSAVLSLLLARYGSTPTKQCPRRIEDAGLYVESGK